MRDEAASHAESMVTENVKRRAIRLVEKAFSDGEAEGLPIDAVAHAALFAAITTLVECFGEEEVARLIAGLPEQIDAGSYTLSRTLQ